MYDFCHQLFCERSVRHSVHSLIHSSCLIATKTVGVDNGDEEEANFENDVLVGLTHEGNCHMQGDPIVLHEISTDLPHPPHVPVFRHGRSRFVR
jgi:hypothetical protein